MKNPFSALGTFIGNINVAGARLGAVFIAMMTLLITFEVISRKLFNFSTLLADEVSGYLLIGIVFLGMAYCLSSKGHIYVEFAIDRASPKVQDWLRIFGYIIAISYVSIVIYTSIKLTADSYRIGAHSYGMLEAPIFPFQAIIPLGMTLFAVQLIVELVRTIRSFGKRTN